MFFTRPTTSSSMFAFVSVVALLATVVTDRAATALPGEASVIRILTLDESSTAVCDAIDYNVATGNFYAALRAALADERNFGPDGVIQRYVEFVPSTPRITGSALEGADMMLLSVNAAPLTGCELQFLQDFMSQGGGVLAFSNDVAFEVGPLFGATGRAGVEVGHVVAKALDSPIVDGPFGRAPETIPLMWHRLFQSIGEIGTEIYGAPKGLAFLVSFELGKGRALLACDEEWVGAEILEGCAVGDLDEGKIILFLNAFAFTSPGRGFEFKPPPGLLGDINEDCRVDGADLGLLLAAWDTDDRKADLNGDGNVDGADLGTLLANWTD